MHCMYHTRYNCVLQTLLHLIYPAGSDCTLVTTDLTFNNAAIPQTVTIPILGDLLLEDSEVFNVTLTTNNSSVMLLPFLANVIIENVEGKLKEVINHTVVALGYRNTETTA